MATISDREQIDRIVLSFAEYLKQIYKIQGVYLFGSYAKGNFDKNSDIDIAVVAEDFTGDLIEDTFRLMKLRRKIDNRIEPHPFKVEDFNEYNPVAREVMETGNKIV